MIPASHLHTLSIFPSFFRTASTSIHIFFLPGKKRAKSAPPLKGILKTNHYTKQTEVPQNFTSEVIRWPPMPTSPSISTCCCCPAASGAGLTNHRGHTVMHPDDPERNYVSHCHTENRLWRPDAVVIHHRDLAASKPQLQQDSSLHWSRVKHNQIYTSWVYICEGDKRTIFT